MDSIVNEAIDEAEAQEDGATKQVGGPDESDAGARSGTMTDEELQDVLQDLQTNITVVGCGGAGGNTVTRMMEEGIHGAKLAAANTDAQHLADEVQADTKILIGKKRTGGRGAGSVPSSRATRSSSSISRCCRVRSSFIV